VQEKHGEVHYGIYSGSGKPNLIIWALKSNKKKPRTTTTIFFALKEEIGPFSQKGPVTL
jgi:hypothetical protein